MWKRFMVVFAAMSITFSYLYMRIYNIAVDDEYRKAAVSQGKYVLTVGKTYGNIYDRNMNLLNNNSYKYIAAVNPTTEGITHVMEYACDKKIVSKEAYSGLPFVCEVSEDCTDTSDVKMFKITERNPDNQLAVHLIGYTRDNMGVSGIEYAYDYILRNECSIEKAVFEITATGGVLDGAGISSECSEVGKYAVITTIDKDIQQICENAGKNIEQGAIVVITTDGEIIAMASFPTFDLNNLEASLDDENKPFINRALLPYNVGSIFKLVTAASAIEQGIDTSTVFECKGYTDVNGKIFRCHNLSGHGELSMAEAMKESCNTYFINLSKEIDGNFFVDTAKKLGFGEKIYLANGITSSQGNIQSYNDMFLPAEKANMSFGQGKLTATPVQIARMTAAIANGGVLPELNVIMATVENESISYTSKQSPETVMSFDTSFELRKFMEYSVNNDVSNAKPFNTTAAGKTSTAQTGIYDESGNEILQAWFTGYFPAEKPEYIVTVFVENGKSGNTSAAPVFKEIAENITALEKEKTAERIYDK